MRAILRNPRTSKRALTKLRQDERYPEVPIATQKEPKASGCNLRNTMRLQPNASEALSPPVTRELLCALHHNSKGDKTTLRQHERFPEVPVTTREEPKTSGFNLGNITRYTSQCKMRHISPAATREQSCTLPCNSKGGLTSLRKHARFPSFIFKNLEEPKASCWNSRKTKSSNHNHHHCKHEMRPFSPAAPQEQSGMPF